MADKNKSLAQAKPVVCPFTIIVDTREQRPFTFQALRTDADKGRRPLHVSTYRDCLPSGDYSIAGADYSVLIERKSKDDLFGTIGQGRARFQRELERLAQADYAAVVVEADWSMMHHVPPAYSQLTLKTVFRSVVAWQVRFPNVHWWFCPGRAFAEVATFRILERVWKDAQSARPLEVPQ